VAIVVVGTTSGESEDRASLSLDGGADLDVLIDSVSKANKNTIVLVQAPGAVTMPWRTSVRGIMILFLGGQETGNAWADVVFGSVPPEGRLPIMLPETEWDAIPPNSRVHVPYSEGLQTSYRSDFQAAYPFGHGLTYTKFEYAAPVNVSCADLTCHTRIVTTVTNVGTGSAPDVVQLYLGFPSAAGQPKMILKGFKKTGALAPGASEVVTLNLTERDLSYYDPGRGGFVKATGSFTAMLGASSADIRQTMTFCVGTCDEPSEASSAIFVLSFIVAAIIVVGIVGGLVWRLTHRGDGGESEGEYLSDEEGSSDTDKGS